MNELLSKLGAYNASRLYNGINVIIGSTTCTIGPESPEVDLFMTRVQRVVNNIPTYESREKLTEADVLAQLAAILNEMSAPVRPELV